MSSPPRVLITGANGFLAFDILVHLLQTGYRVRAAVRRQDAITTIQQAPDAQPHIASQALDFALVPDQTLPSAYTAAANDCTFIIHAASPLPVRNPGSLNAQAVGGVKSVLEAAEATPTIKRVVITSSWLALRPFDEVVPWHPVNQARSAGDRDAGKAVTVDATVAGGDPKSNAELDRYSASKIAARNHVLDYVANRDPSKAHFSIVNLCPGYVCGKQRLAKRQADAFLGTNCYLMFPFYDYKMGSWYGLPEGTDGPTDGVTLHIDDCTAAHVNALDEQRVPGAFRQFLLATTAPYGVRWEEQRALMEKHLPKEAANTPWVAEPSK